jgi:predicted alpha/beta-hydrolase family hydrolase
VPIREFLDRSVDPHVRGYLHEPETSNGSGLVLTHGAGSNANAPLLMALANTFCAHGFTILRCDLPYRQTRSFGPPGPADGARDRAGLKNAVAAVRQGMAEAGPFKPGVGSSGDSQNKVGMGGIFLGGHSYGGRQASMLCAEDPDVVSGLLLLSYPLHPPRKPEQQRTQHLPNLRTPTLFVSGTRDPFGSIAEIQQAIKMIPARTKLISIEGAGHDLNFKATASRGKSKKDEQEGTAKEGKTKKADLPTQIYSDFVTFFTESI